jgi:hypothetical protein
MSISERELKAMLERAEKATAGPWEATILDGFCTCPLCDGEGEVDLADISGDGWVGLAQTYGVGDMIQLNADFITHARDDLPAVIAELMAARKLLRALSDCGVFADCQEACAAITCPCNGSRTLAFLGESAGGEG